jgi:hypothetical protein
MMVDSTTWAEVLISWSFLFATHILVSVGIVVGLFCVRYRGR